MSDPRNKTANCRPSSCSLLGVLAAITGMAGRIEDTDDMDAKEAAYNEMLEGKWAAIYARDLKPGHRMRDAAGGEVEITGVTAVADDHIYATTKDRLGMHIPRTGLVLISPNVESTRPESKPSDAEQESGKGLDGTPCCLSSGEYWALTSPDGKLFPSTIRDRIAHSKKALAKPELRYRGIDPSACILRRVRVTILPDNDQVEARDE